MNNNDISLFRSLSLDIGAKPVNDVNLPELSRLKDEMLELAEIEFDDWPRFQKWKRDVMVAVGYSVPDDCRTLDVVTFRDVYQLLSFLLKTRVLVTPEMEAKYVNNLKETEACTRAWRRSPTSNVCDLARIVCRFGMRNLDLSPERVSEFCRHGPGAVFSGEVGSDKNYFSEYIEQLHRWFGFDLHFANSFLASDLTPGWHSISRSVKARLALVPKTWKGPRGVFVSPKEAVFCQLGIDEVLKRCVVDGPFSCCWDPTDQTPSQELAFVGSYNRMWATIDLTDASDRIPLSLIAYLFDRKSYLALASTRPSFVLLPNGEEIKLRMLAPMGDGKTFSALSIVCICVCVAAMLHHDGYVSGRRLSTIVIGRYLRYVRVFGDDIVVPTRYFAAVCDGLQVCNLKVNKRKSFAAGYFREACGVDAFNGVDVTPVRSKIDWDRRDLVLQLVGLHNYVACNYNYPRLLVNLESRIRSLAAVGWTSRCDKHPYALQTTVERAHFMNVKYCRSRFNTDLQRVEFRMLTSYSPILYPESSDPRWDLSYRLLPKGRLESKVTYASGPTVIKVGSPRQLARDREISSSVPGLGTIRSPRATAQHAWVSDL